MFLVYIYERTNAQKLSVLIFGSKFATGVVMTAPTRTNHSSHVPAPAPQPITSVAILACYGGVDKARQRESFVLSTLDPVMGQSPRSVSTPIAILTKGKCFFLCPLYRSRGFGQQTCAWRATPYPSRRDPSPSPVLQFTAGWSTRPLQFVLLELLR